MLVIRLQRTGRRNSPAFRVVAAEKRKSAKGKFKEVLGHYIPTRDPSVFEYNEERIKYYISVGAQPSDTVARLLTKAGMKGLEKFIDSYAKQKSRKEVEEPEAPAPSPVPAADVDTSSSKEDESTEEVAPEKEKPTEEVKVEKEQEEKPADEVKEEKKEEDSTSEEVKNDSAKEEKAEDAKEETAPEEKGDKDDK